MILTGANLNGANLMGVHLTHATVSLNDLHGAHVYGLTMPDGSILGMRAPDSHSEDEEVKVSMFAWYAYVVGFLVGVVLVLTGFVIAIDGVFAGIGWNLWGLILLLGGGTLAYFARRAAVRRQHP